MGTKRIAELNGTGAAAKAAKLHTTGSFVDMGKSEGPNHGHILDNGESPVYTCSRAFGPRRFARDPFRRRPIEVPAKGAPKRHFIFPRPRPAPRLPASPTRVH